MEGILSNIFFGLNYQTIVKIISSGFQFNAIIVISLPAHRQQLDSLYQIIAKVPPRRKLKFCFLIPADFNISADLTEGINSFFFLASYFSLVHNSPLLIYNDNLPKVTISLIKKQFFDQDLNFYENTFSNGLINPIDEINSSFKIIDYKEVNHLFNIISNFIQLKCWAINQVVIKVDTLSEYENLEQELNNLDKFIQNKNPEFYEILTHFKKLAEDNKQQQHLNSYLNTEIDNLKWFNHHLKSEDETEKILNFYHSQYEVLPLWYKRFGHVIKIITGKRKIPFFSNK